MIANIPVGNTATTLSERVDVDNTERALLTVFFCNFGSAAVDLSIYLKGAGTQSADNTSVIVKDVEIGAGDTFQLDAGEKIILKGHTVSANRNVLVAIASAAGAITATVSYKDL